MLHWKAIYVVMRIARKVLALLVVAALRIDDAEENREKPEAIDSGSSFLGSQPEKTPDDPSSERTDTTQSIAQESKKTIGFEVITFFRHAFRDGTKRIALDPWSFIEKLSALVPAPKAHLVTYHGILAPA